LLVYAKVEAKNIKGCCFIHRENENTQNIYINKAKLACYPKILLQLLKKKKKRKKRRRRRRRYFCYLSDKRKHCKSKWTNWQGRKKKHFILLLLYFIVGHIYI
jgi:hypothetical protein